MEIYNSFEQYLPEMKDVRQKYNEYIRNNAIYKTNSERLYDYFILISKSYQYDKFNHVFNFKEPDIESSINTTFDDETIADPIYRTVATLANRSRHKKMSTHTEISSIVLDELKTSNVEGCQFDDLASKDWYFKTFPLYEKRNNKDCEELKQIVRYALNVVPNIGLFKKLDALCMKNNVFYYKVAKEDYNTRVDPIIIYAAKDTQEKMVANLSTELAPYRRKDDYNALGYKNINNLIHTADETKKEKVEELIFRFLGKEDTEKYIRMREIYGSSEIFRTYKREYFKLRNEIHHSGQICKRALITYMEPFVKKDYCLSLSDFQSCNMIVSAYCKAKQLDDTNVLTKSPNCRT